MKTLYLDTRDERLETWLKEFLSPYTQVASEDQNADVIVLSTIDDEWETRCKALSEAGRTVFVLSLENKGTAASKISRVGGKIVTYRGIDDAHTVLGRLVEVIVAPPAPLKKTIVAIHSTKQAGGSFVAWNLWSVLKQQGLVVSLCSLCDEESPLHTWLPDDAESVRYGTSDGATGDQIWIVDATSTTKRIDDADITLLVVDSDPAKLVPNHPGAFTVTNRVWPGANQTFPYIPDLGKLQVQAMQKKTAAALLDEDVFQLFVGLWRHWNGETMTLGEDMTNAKTEQPVPVSHSTPPWASDAFVFDDEGGPAPSPDAFKFD